MIIKSNAATPEEMRDNIVEYLKYQASIKRSQSALAKRKTAKAGYNLQAETFEFAAKSISEIVITF